MDRHEGLGAKGLGHKRGGRVVHALLEADPRPQLYRLGGVHLVDRLREGDGLDMLELEHRLRLVRQHRFAGALERAHLQPAELDGAWRVVLHAPAVAQRGVLLNLAVLRQVVLQLDHRVQLSERTQVEELADAHKLRVGIEAAPDVRPSQYACPREHQRALQLQREVQEEHEGAPLLVELLVEDDVKEKVAPHLLQWPQWGLNRRSLGECRCG